MFVSVLLFLKRLIFSVIAVRGTLVPAQPRTAIHRLDESQLTPEALNFFSRNARPTYMQPARIANQPIIQTTESAPASGWAMTRTPKATDSRPFRASHHSPSICLRNWMAPQICSTPTTIAQLAISISRTSAGMPGQKNDTTPAIMLTTPARANHQRDDVSPPLPDIAAATAKIPSETA